MYLVYFNFKAKLEKLESLPETKLLLWQQFLLYIRNKLQQQIQTDLRFLEPGRDRFQHLKATVQETIINQPVEIQLGKDDLGGIPPEIYSQLYKILLECDQFESALRLRTFFRANAPLTPWQHRWQTGSPSELVEDAIGYLNNKFRSDTMENALVILVRLLASSIDPADSRHQTLTVLAKKLETFLFKVHLNN